MRWFLLLAILMSGAARTFAQGECLEPRLSVGIEGAVLSGASNRLRDAPSTSGTQVGSIPGGAVFEVLSGPTCADGFLWWEVRYGDITAYTVEASSEEYFVEPVSGTPPTESTEECVFEPRLKIGGLAFVNSTTPQRMRDQPSTQGREIRQIQNDQNMRVLDGPVCAGGYVWWQVTYKDSTGWTVEGGEDGYSLDGIDPTPTPVPSLTFTPSATFTATTTPTPTISPTPTLTPTATMTPHPELLTIYDLQWSADSSTLYVLEEQNLVAFDTAFDTLGVPVMANPGARYRHFALDPAADDAVYMMGERTLDYAIIGETSNSQLYTGEQLSAFSISADGSRYAFVDYRGNDETVVGLVYETGSDAPLREIELPMDLTPGTMALSPDGRMIALSQIATEVQRNLRDTFGVQALEEGTEIPFTGTYMSVSDPAFMAFTHDSSSLIALSLYGDLERYAPDGTRGESFIRSETARNYYITDLVIHPQNTQIAMVEYDTVRSRGVLRVYNSDSMTEIFAFDGTDAHRDVYTVAYSPNGEHIAIDNDGRVLIFDTRTFDQVAELDWITP